MPMDKPKFKKGDLVRWKHGTDIGVVVEFGYDMPATTAQLTLPATQESYALVHWIKGSKTKVYEKHSNWHGVEVVARAEEK